MENYIQCGETVWEKNFFNALYVLFKAMPKNAQTSAQLHSSHTLVK